MQSSQGRSDGRDPQHGADRGDRPRSELGAGPRVVGRLTRKVPLRQLTRPATDCCAPAEGERPRPAGAGSPCQQSVISGGGVSYRDLRGLVLLDFGLFLLKLFVALLCLLL